MIRNIIYVEDATDSYDRIVRAVSGNPSIRFCRAEMPEDISDVISFDIDMILADVYFRDKKTKEKSDRLLDIIAFVRSWEKDNEVTRHIPIIAYTRQGRAALDNCLEKRDELFDIWDKKTADPAYVAWRLDKMLLEISRFRPDKYLQGLIRSLKVEGEFHEKIVSMTKKYDEGIGEINQINRIQETLDDIIDLLGLGNDVREKWNALVAWDFTGKSIIREMRGCCRHVINVFWLGYYFLFCDKLSNYFRKNWSDCVNSRYDGKVIDDENYEKEICRTWFLTALFHDIGKCIEQQYRTSEIVDKIYNIYDNMGLSCNVQYEPDINLLVQKAKQKISQIYENHNDFNSECNMLQEEIKESIEKGKPDHGFISALLIEETIIEQEPTIAVKEASNAVLFHNIISKVDQPISLVNWDNDPIACLLIMCDQIQTWDREQVKYGDQIMDMPERSELAKLEIHKQEKGPMKLDVEINYLTSKNLDKVPELYEIVRKNLKTTVRDNIKMVTNKIEGTWPFDIHGSIFMDYEDIGIKFSNIKEQ
jgi:hypothetical protein